MAKPLIARETILETALALLQQEGVDALNMRTLTAALGCSSRTLYQQVGKRDALVRELIRYHFSRIELDFLHHADWRESATSWACALRNALLLHPNLLRLMGVDDRAAIVGYVDQLLKVLLQAGFPRELALRSCRVLAHTVLSLTLIEIDTPPLPVRRQSRSRREIEFEHLLLAQDPRLGQSGHFQDVPEVFGNAVRWLVEGIGAELDTA